MRFFSRMSKKFFSREFIFADGPGNYFSWKFNFSNCPYFSQNRENFFPLKFLPTKYTWYKSKRNISVNLGQFKDETLPNSMYL